VTVDYSLADNAAREQIRSLLGETLFVEAGAGTGKTAALVDRYLHLVLDGRSVERIVAITFTDKAAAELRDRVRRVRSAMPLDPPPGCVFSTRCPYATDRCRSERPLQRPLDERLVACHYAENFLAPATSPAPLTVPPIPAV